MSADSLRNYDPNEVVIVWGGHIVSGYAEDFITVSQDEDTWELTTGTDGSPVRSLNQNRGGTATLRLLHTSPSNDIFSAAHARDRLKKDMHPPFFVKDLNGRALVAAEHGWIKKPAEWVRGKTVGIQEWVFALVPLTMHQGGN